MEFLPVREEDEGGNREEKRDKNWRKKKTKGPRSFDLVLLCRVIIIQI